MTGPTWATAYLDLPASSLDRGVAFWRAVTGYGLSPARGEHREFATLEPGEGDAFLCVQRVADGPGGIHLDLHVADPRAGADAALALGAVEVADRGYVVLRSPGGFTFCLVPGCLVPGHESMRPPAATWGDGGRSLVDQVCLDIPAAGYDEECAFWEALTGWESGRAPCARTSTSPATTGSRRYAATRRWARSWSPSTSTGRCSATRPGRRTA